jgi:hypothetical protein
LGLNVRLMDPTSTKGTYYLPQKKILWKTQKKHQHRLLEWQIRQHHDDTMNLVEFLNHDRSISTLWMILVNWKMKKVGKVNYKVTVKDY